MEILDIYIKELEDDTTINRFNLEEKQLKMPAIRAKWLSRYANTKKDLYDLYDMLEEAKEKITLKIKEESKISLSDIAAEKQSETHELVRKIKKEIKVKQLLIDYLEKVEKTTSTITYDIKNIVDLIKAEQS